MWTRLFWGGGAGGHNTPYHAVPLGQPPWDWSLSEAEEQLRVTGKERKGRWSLEESLAVPVSEGGRGTRLASCPWQAGT